MTTGSRGETMAGLTRIEPTATTESSDCPTDMVILSAHPIPATKSPWPASSTSSTAAEPDIILRTAGRGARLSRLREEIALLHALVKPILLPIHGEYSKLWRHAELAEALGTRSENIVIPEISQVIEMSQHTLAIVGEVPTGGVLVDGLGIGDVGNVVLRDRKHLSQDGLIIVVMAIDRDSGALVSGPDIISRGFVYVRENEDIIECSRELALATSSSATWVDGL